MHTAPTRHVFQHRCPPLRTGASPRRGTRALLGALACLAVSSAGCTGPKSPPSLPAITSAPVVLPAPAQPADATMFGYLHVRDPLALAGKVAPLIGVSPEQLAAQRGLKLGEMVTGAPLVGFLWDPQGATPQDVPAVVLAPVPEGGALVGTLKSATPTVGTATVGKQPTFTAVFVGPSGQQHLSSGGDGLLAVAAAKQPFDLTLYVNAAPIMAKYGPILQAGIKSMETALAMSAAANPNAPSPKATTTMLQQVVSDLSELQSLTFGATVTGTGTGPGSAVELSTLTTRKQSEGGGPIAAPDLAQFVPPGDLRMQWNTRDVKKLIDWYLRVYGGFLEDKPALRAQVTEIITEWLKAGRQMQTAMGLSYRSGQGLSVQGIMRVEDGPAALLAMRRSVKVFSTGPVHEAYKSMGMEFDITLSPNVRKVQGHPVDRFSYSLKVNTDKNPSVAPAKAMLEQFSGMTYEVAQVGPYMVYSLGGAVDPMVQALLSGKGQYPFAAAQNFPAGGSLYLELDLGRVLDWMRALVPAGQKNPIPTLPGSGNVISAWSYDSGAASYYKLTIPTQLIQNVLAALH